MTTKAKRAAVIPLVPLLADALRSAKTRGVDFSGKVFPRGLPSVVTLARDLAACGIEPENEQGRVDFHALRHTFASILANVGVSELVRVKLARHSEWRQTDPYTDPASLPLFAEMEKYASALPSSIPSPISGKKGQRLSQVGKASRWCPRGLEPQGDETEEPDGEDRCRSAKDGPSPIPSLKAGKLSPELAEIVATWPTLLLVLRSLRGTRTNTVPLSNGAWIVSFIRVLEPQRQGRPHYHLLVAVPWDTAGAQGAWTHGIIP
jgi:hypothetical protein